MKTLSILFTLSLLPVSLNGQQPSPEVLQVSQERDRLLKLVLRLQKDFGETLGDYEALQSEYSKVLNRQSIPDQSGKVQNLQRKLQRAVARINALEREKDQNNNTSVLKTDLANIRKELQNELKELLTAKAQLLRMKTLESKNKLLEESLKQQPANPESALAEIQKIKAERDTLANQIEKLMTRVAVAEEGKRVAEAKIVELEGETIKLKQKITSQANELQTLKTALAGNKNNGESTQALKDEQNRLTQLLNHRETELNNLRQDLAAEIKRSLEVPLLVKSRDNLQNQLNTSNTENKALKDRQIKLQNEIETVRQQIIGMQQQLDANQTAMAKVDEVQKTNEALVAETNTLKTQLLKAPKPEELAQLRTEKEDLSTKLTQREKELNETRLALGALELKSSVAEKQLAALRRQNAKIPPLLYSIGQTDFTNQYKATLKQINATIKEFPNARFEIVGHTCDEGDAGKNLTLSQERAKALHDFLVENNIPTERLSHRGVGQTQPSVPNNSEENRAKNRRVEIEILD